MFSSLYCMENVSAVGEGCFYLIGDEIENLSCETDIITEVNCNSVRCKIPRNVGLIRVKNIRRWKIYIPYAIYSVE